MKIVYYYVLYLRGKKDPEMIELHLKPFKKKDEAETYRRQCDNAFGERVYHSKIKKVDLSKSKDEIWLWVKLLNAQINNMKCLGQ